MEIGNRNKKRILIFSIIPVLVAIPFFTDDFVIRLLTSITLTIYTAFIIFLRDSSRIEESFDTMATQDSIVDEDIEGQSSYTESVEEDGFKIVSPNKKIEVVRSNEMSSSDADSASSKSYFKPPDLKSTFEKIATEKVPKNISHDQHFGFALEKILLVIREAYFAHSALFFWYNKKTEKLTLEKFSSVSTDVKKQKYDIEDDVLSKIVHNQEPELLTDLIRTAEYDVIRYYNRPQGIKSFVGVPLYYGENLAGVLALDAKENDAFGIETIYSLGRFVRVISLLISLFDEKFSDSQAEKRLTALLDIVTADKKFENESDLYSTIENSVKKLINWDVFTFIYFDPSDQKFKTSKVFNNTSLKYIGENLDIEISGTLVGKSIVSGVPVKIDNTSTEKSPRFVKNEDITFGGSFLALPLAYDGQIYGVFCFEGLKPNIYNSADVVFIKKATKIFSYIVYSFSTQKILRSLLSLDIDTKLLNSNSFLKEVNSDLVKSKSAGLPGALALVKIDEFIEEESFFEGDPFPKVLKSIVGMMKEATSAQNILGRLNRDVLGIYFFNTSAKDVFLWAEKLRIKIARTPISVVSKQTTFTVSIGIAGTNEKMDVNGLMENAELALNKATEKGGNSVKNI
ncbi:MAG: GAF domain-containing protein [Bacteroidota bacterium]